MTTWLGMLAACGGIAASGDGQPKPAAEAQQAVPALLRVRGEAIVGKDGYGLTPCGETRQRIVRFAPAAQGFIDRFLEPGGRMEFFLDAWVREEQGQWIVESVERAHTEGPRCDRELQDAAFVAHGTEPFWALSLTADGWELQRPDAEPLRVEAEATKTDKGYAWKSAQAMVEVAPGYCADGMADAVSAWTVSVTLGGETLSGCAYRGSRPLP